MLEKCLSLTHLTRSQQRWACPVTMTSDILVNGELETSIYQAKTCNSALKTTRSSATWLRNLSFDVRIKDLHCKKVRVISHQSCPFSQKSGPLGGETCHVTSFPLLLSDLERAPGRQHAMAMKLKFPFSRRTSRLKRLQSIAIHSNSNKNVRVCWIW